MSASILEAMRSALSTACYTMVKRHSLRVRIKQLPCLAALSLTITDCNFILNVPTERDSSSLFEVQ